MWLSLVERCVRDAEVAGSNPVIPTILVPFLWTRNGNTTRCETIRNGIFTLQTKRAAQKASAFCFRANLLVRSCFSLPYCMSTNSNILRLNKSARPASFSLSVFPHDVFPQLLYKLLVRSCFSLTYCMSANSNILKSNKSARPASFSLSVFPHDVFP